MAGRAIALAGCLFVGVIVAVVTAIIFWLVAMAYGPVL